MLATDQSIFDLDHHWRPQVKEGAFDTLRYDFIGDASQLPASLAHAFGRIFRSHDVPLVDTRKLIGHQTDSAGLANMLSPADRKRIETLYAADRELYDRTKADLARLPGFQ